MATSFVPVFAQEASITTGIIGFYEGRRPARKSVTLASELTDVLSRYRFISMVERAKMDSLVREIEAGQSGLVDEATAASAGRIRGCKVIVTGTVRGDRVFARAVHTETATVIASASSGLYDIDLMGRGLALGIESHLARETLRTLRNDSPSIDLVLRAEAGEGKRRLAAGGVNGMRIGEQVSFLFKSRKSGYLTIVDIQPNGDVVILFPNDMTPSNEVKGGVEYSIPPRDAEYVITATEPAGLDTVVAFFTTKKVEWLDMKKLTGTGFRSVREGERASTVLSHPGQRKLAAGSRIT